MKSRVRYLFTASIVLLFVTICFPVVVAHDSSHELEPAEASKTDRSRVATPASNNSSTLLFLETDWQTELPSPEEVALINDSVDETSLAKPQESAPYVPAKSIENTTSSSDPAMAAPYFSGHTWSWEFGTDDRHVEAAEVTRPLEGNWFPKTTYSRIVYQSYVTHDSIFYFYIERGADTHARYVRLYIGSMLLEEDVIYGDSYSAFVPMSILSGTYEITIEIYSGGYVEKGWSLRYFTVMTPDSEGWFQPVRTDYQRFPILPSSTLEFRVPMGPDTTMNIETINYLDFHQRIIVYFVDGQYRGWIYSPGAYEVLIADFTEPGMHDFKLYLLGSYPDYPKSIAQLYITYDYRHVEVDSMFGHGQEQWVYDYVEAYYTTHDYRRVIFHPDQNDLPHIDWIDLTDFRQMYTQYANPTTQGDERWTWGLYCHRLLPYQYWGWGEKSPPRWVIADAIGFDWQKQWILMHEFGHTEHMSEDSGYKYDVYCENQFFTDWVTPHYASSSWTEHLTWVIGVW
ncbi:MAG: hypothetical protein ACXADC_05875 [Candidatus Thorarchaeota archaeon]